MSVAAPEADSRSIQRAPRLALVLFGTLPALAALGPLLTVFGGLFAFRIACALFVIHAVVFLMGRERWVPADAWLAAATVSLAVSGLVGFPRITPDSYNPYSEFFAVMLGLFSALAVRAWQRRLPGLYDAVARGWVAAGLGACGIAVLEVYTGIHLPGYVLEAAPAPAATFGNPNALAIFVVMANVWAIAVRRSSGALWSLSTWALVLGSAPVLYATGARLAMVAWLLVVAWSVWLRIRRSTTGLAGIGAALVPVVAGLTMVAGGPLLLGYATEISTSGSSGSVREQLTSLGLGFAVEHRGLPTWPGAFESLMLEDGGHLAVAGLVNAHNTWVEILVQYGAITLVLLLGWMIACAVARSGARDEAVLAVGTLLVLGVVNSSSLDDSSFWMFLITLAAASRTQPPPLPATARPPEAVSR